MKCEVLTPLKWGRARHEPGAILDLTREELDKISPTAIRVLEWHVGADQLRDDGPTFEEYVAEGYDPAQYPPKGWAAKQSPGLEAYRQSLLESERDADWRATAQRRASAVALTQPGVTRVTPPSPPATPVPPSTPQLTEDEVDTGESQPSGLRNDH